MKNTLYPITLLPVKTLTVLLFISAFFTEASALGERRFKGCHPSEKSKLIKLEDRTRENSKNLIESIRSSLHDKNRESRKVGSDRKLSLAAKILECSIRQIGKLDYKCVDGNNYAGRINWIFGKKININSSVLSYYGESSAAAVILHELTHKCGTTDAAYFGDLDDSDSSPHNKIVGWHLIADTYHYWATHGFCIPGETCPR